MVETHSEEGHRIHQYKNSQVGVARMEDQKKTKMKIKEDPRVVGVDTEDTRDRLRCRRMICCGDPEMEQLTGKKEEAVKIFMCEQYYHCLCSKNDFIETDIPFHEKFKLMADLSSLMVI